ncbi:carbon-nitrogen hydrolase family protein [Pseudomonas oryzihabitans]|uniref:Carbon-nitrogen hydrolase family protein n=1 Tax=Pseudomonas oryzihabitans TaxID=47885 RepID=A0A2Z5AB80_9PSED|nr:carbon-nitrogen hydrolase family protein [Pseudomonas oryzihabitans]AXA67837.1 carbon-nitrogen hydrolase family protein [Pseudomonas oryzihabitans]
MKIVAAQISSYPGKIDQNIAKHISIIERAVSHGAEFVFFPELSLTAYEPSLAGNLAIHINDPKLEVFQQLSDRYGILISVGAPFRVEQGIEIAMFVFQPGLERLIYSKQLLHADETPYFSAGTDRYVFLLANEVLVPAICYESLQPVHAQQASEAGATIYFASVAKSSRGVTAAYNHYPKIARQYKMAVVMANCVGPADNFIAAGRSGVWSDEGDLLIQADETGEALVIYDSLTGEGKVSNI